MLMVACRLMTSGVSGVSSVASRFLRSCSQSGMAAGELGAGQKIALSQGTGCVRLGHAPALASPVPSVLTFWLMLAFR